MDTYAENDRLQLEEIESLTSIYGDDWKCVNEESRVFDVIIKSKEATMLQVVFTIGYPLNSPPIFRLNAPWLSREAKQELTSMLDDIYSQNIGQQIIFLWIDKINEFVDTYLANYSKEDKNQQEKNFHDDNMCLTPTVTPECPTIIHGEPIIDRKSTFQAHLAEINDIIQVPLVKAKLLESRKIANATHNIMAFRITQLRNNFEIEISDCDDDGEYEAGSRLLFLLRTLSVTNVMVIVSRWYGGVLLGADRFKHINNCCRDILEVNGYLKSVRQRRDRKSSQ